MIHDVISERRHVLSYGKNVGNKMFGTGRKVVISVPGPRWSYYSTTGGRCPQEFLDRPRIIMTPRKKPDILLGHPTLGSLWGSGLNFWTITREGAKIEPTKETWMLLHLGHDDEVGNLEDKLAAGILQHFVTKIHQAANKSLTSTSRLGHQNTSRLGI